MKRFLVVAVAALALAPAASAKEFLGLQLCGVSGCATDRHGGRVDGPAGPFGADGISKPPAALGPWYRGTLLMGDNGKLEGRIPFFYVPRGNLVVLQGDAAQTASWQGVAGETAATLERLARRVKPFPKPTLTRVTVDGREVADPQSYERLYDAGSKPTTYPKDTTAVEVVLYSTGATPWTYRNYLALYPKSNLLVRDGYLVSVSRGLADDVAAGRSLDPGGGFPWLPVVAGLGAIALVATVLVRFRPRPSPRPAPQA